MAKLKKDERTRNWSFILYPESAPENWRDIIDDLHIEWVESPLHDKDIDPIGGNKKPHYHILLLFSGKKSYNQVKEITDSVNSPIPQICHSTKGLIRYMAHKDNPDKYQYEWNDIIPHGGVDLNSLCAPTTTERLDIQKEIISFIRDNEITEFNDIVNVAIDLKYNDWLNVLLNYSTLSITNYIRSLRFQLKGIKESE